MHLLIEQNLDLACFVVENVAVRRGIQDVDRILESEYETRRVHRQVSEAQVDTYSLLTTRLSASAVSAILEPEESNTRNSH